MDLGQRLERVLSDYEGPEKKIKGTAVLDELVALPSWMIFSIGLINLMTGIYVWVLTCQLQMKHGSQLGCGY